EPKSEKQRQHASKQTYLQGMSLSIIRSVEGGAQEFEPRYCTGSTTPIPELPYLLLRKFNIDLKIVNEAPEGGIHVPVCNTRLYCHTLCCGILPVRGSRRGGVVDLQPHHPQTGRTTSGSPCQAKSIRSLTL